MKFWSIFKYWWNIDIFPCENSTCYGQGFQLQFPAPEAKELETELENSIGANSHVKL